MAAVDWDGNGEHSIRESYTGDLILDVSDFFENAANVMNLGACIPSDYLSLPTFCFYQRRAFSLPPMAIPNWETTWILNQARTFPPLIASSQILNFKNVLCLAFYWCIYSFFGCCRYGISFILDIPIDCYCIFDYSVHIDTLKDTILSIHSFLVVVDILYIYCYRIIDYSVHLDTSKDTYWILLLTKVGLKLS